MTFLCYLNIYFLKTIISNSLANQWFRLLVFSVGFHNVLYPIRFGSIYNLVPVGMIILYIFILILKASFSVDSISDA